MDLITHLDKVVKIKRDPISETEDRIQEALRKADPGTPEFKALLENQQQCKDLRKTQKDTAGWWQKLMDVLKIGVYGLGTLGLGVLGLALNMEDPRSLKVTEFALKHMPNQKM